MSDRKQQQLSEPRLDTPPSDDRVADTDVESLIEGMEPTALPDEERTVPEDVNEYVADDHETEI